MQRAAAIGRHHVGDQGIFTRNCTDDDYRFTHRRMFGQGGFNFANFNSKTTNFDLLIDPTEIFEFSVWKTSREVARAV